MRIASHRILTLAAALALAAPIWPKLYGAGTGLSPEARVAILRGLVAEYATLQVPLPRGSKGLKLSSSGGIDRESLTHEITQNGTAIPPNVLVQITQIHFGDKEIQFEINGGGKKKTKWYEHIEVGMGNTTTPINNPNPDTTSGNGSMITLSFGKKLPELTVDDLKEALAPVLDFTPVNPLQAANGPIPPEFKEAIEKKEAAVGMNRDMVLAALGQPDRKVRESEGDVEREDWIYGKPPLKTIFVTFEGEEVVDVQEYRGGVRGEVQNYPTEPPR